MNGEEKPKRSRWKLLFIIPAVLFLVLMCALVLVFGIMFLTSVPQDSPSGFMFRTEADMQAIISALRGYHREYEIYPASGKVGLDAAIDHMNRTVVYLPSGPPKDAWGREFTYTNHTDYGKPGVPAFKDPAAGDYYNPDSYQLYSLGIDGKIGSDEADQSRDNINNWLPKRVWRKHYKELTRQRKQD